jgi:hypothetical protein
MMTPTTTANARAATRTIRGDSISNSPFRCAQHFVTHTSYLNPWSCSLQVGAQSKNCGRQQHNEQAGVDEEDQGK